MSIYSSQRQVQIVVALLKANGIKHAVLSPGSKNMSLVISLENDPHFTCYSVVDERSAAYFAIGIALAERAPVVLSCTSAQATRNYIPGMTEAYYRGTPLVVVTADYKPSMIGQGIMQAMDQMSIPSDSAKASVRLPIVRDEDDAEYCARLVNEALLELGHNGSGPVHIDMPVEEHWNGGVDQLPPVRQISRFSQGDAFPSLDHRRVLVVVGQHLPFSDSESKALERFADAYGAVVYTNHLSNYSGSHSVQGSLLIENLNPREFEDYRPDLLITIGGQIGEYGLDGQLRNARAHFQHWRVHPDGKVQDTYGALTGIFECDPEYFFTRYADLADDAGYRANRNYARKWEKAKGRRAIPADLPLSHAYIASVLAPAIPARSIVHLAILSSLRNWNFFELDPSVECYSNVAAFGIDGCLSTFLGHAASSGDRLCFLVIGDLSFFYDMNAVGNRHVSKNARVVLVNNNGGGEFILYSNAASQFGPAAEAHIAAAGHHGSAKGFVESMGWAYSAVHTKDDLRDAAARLVGDSDRPVIVEVFTTMSEDSAGVQLIREANTPRSLERRLAERMSPELKRFARRALRR